MLEPRPGRAGPRARGHARRAAAAAARQGASSRITATARARWPSPSRSRSPGGPGFRPFQRLTWTGGDPRPATWTALDRDGQPVGAAARRRASTPMSPRCARPTPTASRWQCGSSARSRPRRSVPAEVAWSADDGRTVLIHLPQLDAEPLAADAAWPTEATFGFASEPVRVGEDGSTWASESTAGRRVVARRGRADRRGGGPAAPARTRTAALRRGTARTGRVAAGDARADAARPSRRRRHCTDCSRSPPRSRRSRGRQAARRPTSRRTSRPTTRRARRCTSARVPAAREPVLDVRLRAPDSPRVAQRHAPSRRAGGLAHDPALRLAAGRARGGLGALAGAHAGRCRRRRPRSCSSRTARPIRTRRRSGRRRRRTRRRERRRGCR